ncbi:MAG TPA: hypothetical protein PL096_02005 [Micropepsaceae bacterium]|nr:hypothetical protein [Micropepsaceae bacterium]
MTASEIARHYFSEARARCTEDGQSAEAMARQMLSAVISFMLETRTAADVRAELLAASENLDPDADYMFMRP